MKPSASSWLQRLLALLETPRPEPTEYAGRILALQRNIILPIRLLVVPVVLYQFYNSRWLGEVVNAYGVVFDTIQNVLFVGYVLFIIGATVLFYVVRHFPLGAVQWFVFALGLADGLFLGALTFLTSGYESILYWVFPALIVVNAISIPLATPQIVLNLSLCIFFFIAGLLEASVPIELTVPSVQSRVPRRMFPKLQPADFTNAPAVSAWLEQSPEPMGRLMWGRISSETRELITNAAHGETSNTVVQSALADEMNRIFFPPPRYIPETPPAESTESADPNVLRAAVLLLLTFCCYGVQLLVARERRRLREHSEFVLRTEQLRSAGRLAAEVAHQIKNPLAIINNVTYSLRKVLTAQLPSEAKQIEIIQEEVAKADMVITQIMGYAQLTEGRVERINVLAELDRAIADVFPPGVPTQTVVHRDFLGVFPILLMHRNHFTATIGNLLQNARDVVNNRGNVFISARCHEDETVEITVADDGPGIPPDKRERIFEAYYTTKPRGTGIGLSVVKHNAELYGGSVRVESELGKGAKFTLLLPAQMLTQNDA